MRRFASTLKSPTISVNHHDISDSFANWVDDPQGRPRDRFSALRHLRLKAGPSSISPLLQLLSSSPVVSLDLIIREYGGEDPDADLDAILARLKPFAASLEQLFITDERVWEPSRFVADSVRESIRNQVDAIAPQLSFTVGPQYDPFHHLPVTNTPNEPEDVYDTAIQTLDFGRDFLDRLRATNDLDRATTLLELLVPLRGKMPREKD